ncbi:MAG: coproporphyrinogen dehydrogenase HemZ [Oscillospiraceae bacterium]|nr:coproporphyrinogen dehydrogenase HemZ [Oscillospiraceae bacterium]
MTNHPYRYAAERIIREFGFNMKTLPQSIEKAVALSASVESKQKSCVILYDALSEITGTKLPWGIFTGVRPIRFIRENRDNISGFRISDDKLALADEIIDFQSTVLPVKKKRFSLYVGIPFCPSRCRYCSFVSETVEKSRKLIPQYMELLTRELKLLAEYASNCGLFLETIYIGGGTPTSLPTENQIELYDSINRFFDIGGTSVQNKPLAEYTVEAGRPETLTDDVLFAIKNSGATRISINPQSMDNSVLKTVGRGHTSADVISAYERAGKIGFPVINMDIIAGLPGEDETAFSDSLNKVISLEPDNITVHSLAYKRGAERLNSSITGLTETAYGLLKKHGFKPYYLYRLRESGGDNIGYTRKSDKMCLYNIYMMEESSTVLAAGCGGATRMITESGKMIKHYNCKYPYEYIARFDEISKRYFK